MLAIARALYGQPEVPHARRAIARPSLPLWPDQHDFPENRRDQHQDHGITILLVVEQNANLALDISSYAYVLEAGHIAMAGEQLQLRADPRL